MAAPSGTTNVMVYCIGVRPGRKAPSLQERDRARRLGRVLSEQRNAQELTQDAVARAAGMPGSTVGAIETGSSVNPGFFTVADVATVLGIRLDELLASSRREAP